MTDKTALAIVPLNISKLEEITVNRDKNLTDYNRRQLLDVCRKAMSEKRDMLYAKRQEVEASILNAEREAANLSKFRAELDKVDEEIETLRNRKETIILRAENATGFTVDGGLLKSHIKDYGDNSQYKLWDAKHKAGIQKAEAIRTKVTLAQQMVDRFALKFDKVETRLILATTVGEAMDIMSAVLGNGDIILDPKTDDAE